MDKTSLRNIPHITELKAIAIFFIALTHYSQMFSTTFIDEVLAMGQMGCQFFLVVSCFTLSVSQEMEPKSYRQFIIRRFQRISIPWWLALIAYVLAGYGSMLLFKKNYFGTNIDPISILLNFVFLNGLLPFCNNNVVRGGWYIGTTVLLYLLHPFLFNIYKKSMEKCGKYLKVLFPSLLFCICFPVLNVISLNLPDAIENNTFWYFNVINQLTCYSLGFILYDFWKNDEFDKVHIPWIKCGLALLIGAVVFYSNWGVAPLLIPLLFGIVSVYLMIALMKSNMLSLQKLVGEKLNKIGKLSFSLYLTHLFVVWYFTRAIKYVLSRFIISEVLMFFIILPIATVCCYFAAILFNRIVGMIESRVYSNR